MQEDEADCEVDKCQGQPSAANIAVSRDGACLSDHFWNRSIGLPRYPRIRKEIDVKEI